MARPVAVLGVVDAPHHHTGARAAGPAIAHRGSFPRIPAYPSRPGGHGGGGIVLVLVAPGGQREGAKIGGRCGRDPEI